jgi:hypothetical protein
LIVVKRTVERMKRFRFWDSCEHLCFEGLGECSRSGAGRGKTIAATQLADLFHHPERA